MNDHSDKPTKGPAVPKSTEIRKPDRRFLTVNEVADLLRVSRRTVERLVARGELPFVELPLRRGGLRFPRSAIDDFLRDHSREPLR